MSLASILNWRHYGLMDHAEFSPTVGQKFIVEFNRRYGLGNGAFRKYGAKLIGYLRDGPIDYDYHGFVLRLDPTLGGSPRHMLLSPDWIDRKERAFIESRVPQHGRFVDIGACAGFYSFFVAAKRGARVLAFEPDPRLATYLGHNAAKNGLSDFVVEAVALSDTSGSALIDGRDVPTATLMECLTRNNISAIDCLKIDVEGMEDKILIPFFRGAPRSLWPKAILGEHIFVTGWRDLAIRLGYRQLWQTRFNTALLLTDPP